MQAHTSRLWRFGLIAALTLLGPVAAHAEGRQKIRIPVGRAEVVQYSEDVRTVAIAEPKIANAAVGSARTVVVNGKVPGVTTLVIYGEGAHFTTYDVEVVVPNSEREVQLAVRVAEVDTTANRELGLDIVGAVQSTNHLLDGTLKGGLFPTKVSSPSVPLTVGPATDGFLSYTRSKNDVSVQAIWRALEGNGSIRVLAHPTLVARSGEKASFHAGGEFPVPIASSQGTAGGGVTVTIEWKSFGVQVEFTPTVEEDSTITLVVDAEVSQLDFNNSLTLSGFNVPSVVTRRTATTVGLRDGEYLVIGGLKQTDRTKHVDKVPVLGSIPVLGWFFSHSVTDAQERELLIVISPQVLAAAAALPPLPTDAGRGKR
jgi:pilus assembly protein CpaC